MDHMLDHTNHLGEVALNNHSCVGSRRSHSCPISSYRNLVLFSTGYGEARRDIAPLPKS